MPQRNPLEKKTSASRNDEAAQVKIGYSLSSEEYRPAELAPTGPAGRAGRLRLAVDDCAATTVQLLSDCGGVRRAWRAPSASGAQG